VTATELAALVGGEVVGDSEVAVGGVADLASAGPTDLSFVSDESWVVAAKQSAAGVLVVPRELELRCTQIVVDQPRLRFAELAARLVVPSGPSGVSEQVVFGEQVVLGTDVAIGAWVSLGDRVRLGDRVVVHPGVVIGDDCEVGDDSVLHARVSVRAGTRIGQRVVVHDGTVLGADGFGYEAGPAGLVKVPQLGRVEIEDDVEIGANVCIDRATFGVTVVGRGSKIDNLVQIAHNVTIGQHSVVVAQVGLSGSVSIGDQVVIGGQVGFADHVKVGDGARIAARAGVIRDVAAGAVVSGAPAVPHARAVRIHAVSARLPELRERVRALERRLRALEAADPNGI